MKNRVPERVLPEHLGIRNFLWCMLYPNGMGKHSEPCGFWKKASFEHPCVRKGGGQEGGTWRTLKVPDLRHGGHGCFWRHEWCFLPQGRYPGNFVLISQLEVRQEGGVKKGVLGGRWGFLTWDMEDMVVPDVMNDVFLPKGRYPENFVLISQL